MNVDATPVPGEHTCPEEGSTRVLMARDYVTGDVFELRRCVRCGLVRTAPAPGDLSRYYPDAYYGEGARYGGWAEWLLAHVLACRAAAVERANGGPGRVLDIGCGQGLLLDAFRRRGWRAMGVERDDRAAAFARTRLGLDVRTGAWPDVDLPPGDFDAVVLWHVIEHVTDPSAALAWAARRLRPGGVLFLGAPNIDSLEARWAGPGWFHLDVPRHLTHFTPDTLSRALEGAGLRAVSWSTVALEYDLVSVVQSAFNRLGLGHNQLFMWMRRASARPSTRAAGSWLRAGIMIALAPVLAGLGLVWTLAAGPIGAGATMTVVARRTGEV